MYYQLNSNYIGSGFFNEIFLIGRRNDAMNHSVATANPPAPEQAV
ncbi:hypothetical protein LT85_2826 [Collimonas arenae]|uniref:Uncharacterized protein n=1 Tax=Collimonas arenae TaxID=279058 RepID=A0A0A1FE97_9BURK|nr:hypothetical protein LT85_2826 [Collimonas arenae]